jgi:hypothetical protein
MAAMIHGLDDQVEVSGRPTTIRKEWKARKVIEMRLNDGPVTGQKPLKHWVVIVGDDPRSTYQFDVSEADFKLMRGEPAADHSPP